MPEKKYLIEIPGKEGVSRLNETDWVSNKDSILAKYPNANVVSIDMYDPEDIQDNDAYLVSIEGKNNVSQFSGSDWAKHKDTIMAKYPNAQVSRMRGVDYYYDQANELGTALEEKDAEIRAWQDSMAERTGGSDWSAVMLQHNGLKPIGTGMDTEKDEAIAAYVAEGQQLQEQKNQLQDAYDNNPRVKAAREEWEKKAEEEFARYQKEYLASERQQVLNDMEADVDIKAATRGKLAMQDETFANFDNDTQNYLEKEKLEMYHAALQFYDKAEEARAGQLQGFWKGMGDVAEHTFEQQISQKDIATYSDIVTIMKKLEKKYGTLKDVSEEQIERSLEPSEKALLKAFFEYSDAISQNSGDKKYKAGQQAGQWVQFAIEFALGGKIADSAAKGLSKGVVTGLERWAAKALQGTFKGVARNALAKAGTMATRGLTNVAIATALRPSTYTHMAQAATTIDERGHLNPAKEMSLSFLDDAIETVSEKSGELIGKVLGVPLKPVKKWTSKAWDAAFGGTKFAEWGKLLTNGPVADYLKQAGFNGYPIEILEEYVGNAMRLPMDSEALKNMHKDGNGYAMLVGFLPATLIGGGINAAQFGFAQKRAINSASALQEMLLNKGFGQGRSQFLSDYKRDVSPLELGKDMYELKQELEAKGASQDELQMVSDYASAVAEYQTLRGGMKEMQSKEREQVMAELEGQYKQFYKVDENGNKSVDLVTDKNGRQYFITSPAEMGEVAAIDKETGAQVFLNESDINISGNVSLDNYLDGVLQGRRELAQMERMTNERDEQIAKLSELLPKTLNLGTSGTPNEVVVKDKSQRGVTVVDAEGNEAVLSWEQVGRSMGMPINILTDAQIAEAEAAAYGLGRAEKKAQRATTQEEANSVQRQGEEIAEQINEATPRPEEKYRDQETGEVDENAFWENDPEGYCQWNDREMQDNGADSMEQIESGIAAIAKRMAELDKMASDDPKARKVIKAEKTALQNRLDRLAALQQAYTQASISEEQRHAEQTLQYRERIDQWRKQYGVPVFVYESEEEVKDKSAINQIRLATTPGWQNSKGVHIYLPHVDSMATLEETLKHETTGHAGFALLDEKSYNELMDKVWAMMSDSARNTFYNYASVASVKDADTRRRKAAEEFASHVAEQVDLGKATAEQKTIWERIVDFFRRLFSDDNLDSNLIANAIRDNHLRLMEKAQQAQQEVDSFKAEAQEQVEKGLVPEEVQSKVKAADGTNNYSTATYHSWVDNLGNEHTGTREEVLTRMQNMGFSEAEIKDMAQRMDTAYAYMEKLRRLTNPDGTVRFDEFNRWAEKTPLYKQIGRDYVKAITSLVSNGDYPVNLEITTDCIKREAFTQLLNELVKRGAELSGMGPGEIVTIQKMMKQYGIEVACNLCFVEGKRLQIINWATQIVNDWNNALVEAGVETDEFFEFGKDGDAFIPSEEWRTHEDKSKVAKVMRNLDDIALLFQGLDPKTFKAQKRKNKKALDKYIKEKAEKAKKSVEQWKPSDEQKREMKKIANEGLYPTYVNENMEEYRNAFNAMRNEWLDKNPNADPLSFNPTQKQWDALGKIRNRQIDNVRAKMVRLIMEYPEMRKKMTLNNLLGSKGLMEIRQQHGQAYADLYSIILQRFGTGTPKPVQDAVPYDGEVMTLSESAFKKANEIGGARLFSFSDFDITKVFDYMQMFFDLEANRQMLQSYTKEVAAVLIFGRSNAKFNISTLANAIVPDSVKEEYNKASEEKKQELRHKWAEYAGLEVDAEGNIIGINFSEEHSVSPAFAQQIFHDDSRNKDCGAIMVGASVNHAIFSAAQQWIRMVIPFHLSGMPMAAREKTDVKWYTDNTAYQSTRKKTKDGWSKISSSEDTFKFYNDMNKEGWNMRNKTREYLAWCAEKGFRPKFDWGINSDYYRAYCEENGYTPNQQIIDMMDADTTDGVWNQYYKFLTDFTAYKPVFNEQGEMIDEIPSPQLPVQSNFDFSEMEKDVLFEGERSMLEHREGNIQRTNRHIEILAEQATAYLNGDITEEEMGLRDDVHFENTADAERYLEEVAKESGVNMYKSEVAIADKEVANVIVDSSKTVLPTNREDALKAVNALPKPFINEDQQKEIIVSNNAIRHTATQDSEHDHVDVRMLGVVDQVIRNAVKIGEEPVAEDEVGKTHLVEVYYCPVNIDGKQYSVRMVVKQYENRGRVMEDFRMYDMAAKKRKSGVSSQGTGTESLTPLLTPDSAYKVRDLIHNTKESDKNLVGIDGETTMFKTANNNQAIFVSNAAKAVEGIKQEKATPEQWLKMIEKNGGLKAGEDKWMGLSDWLKASDKKTLTKQEVLDFINEHMIQIEEVHYGINLMEDREQALHDNMIKTYGEDFYKRFVGDAFIFEDSLYGGDWHLSIQFGDTAAELYNEYNEDKVDYNEDEGGLSIQDEEKVRKWATAIAREMEAVDEVRQINPTRKKYSTGGLKNHHEIALTVPTIESWNKGDDIHFGDAGEGRAVAWIRFGDGVALMHTETSKELHNKVKTHLAQLRDKYGEDSSSWTEEEREHLFQLIENTRRAKKESNVLVIDEIQSQRHQDAKDGGYRTKVDEEQHKEQIKAVSEKQNALLDYIGTLVQKYPNTDYDIEDVFKNFGSFSAEEKEELKRLKGEYDAEYAKTIEEGKGLEERIPEAPFEKNWAELAMKRMLRYAAENGYDAIAWTEGEQQVMRYKSLYDYESISVGKWKTYGGTKKRSVDVLFKNGTPLNFGVDEKGKITRGRYKGEKLSSVLSKEVSKKIMTAEEAVVLKGEDLTFGEGMKHFYDKMLPSFMNKYGKKWGVSVDSIYLKNLGMGLTMHSIPVTEEMKASVLEGQTMFRTRRADEKPSEFLGRMIPEFENTYNVKVSATIVKGTSKKRFAEAIGVDEQEISNDVYMDFLKVWEESGGAHLIIENNGNVTERILIFAQKIYKAWYEVDNALFHENIHGFALDKPEVYELGQWLFEAETEDKHILNIRNYVREIYSEGEYHKEMLTNYVATMMAVGYSRVAMNSIPEEYKPLLNYIYERFGYNPETEDRIRRERYIDSQKSNGELQKRNTTNGEDSPQSSETLFSTRISPEARREMDVISAQAIVNGNYMKAPNGKDSKLTPEQWALVRTQNFINWFGDWINDPENASKVVDENGEPMVVYHGTAGVINEFEDQQRSPGFWFVDREDVANGYAESASAEFGKEKNIIPVFLNLRNPRIEDSHAEYPAEFALKSYVENDKGVYEVFDTYEEAEAYREANVPDAWVGAAEVGDQHDLVERAKELGNDGVIMLDMHDQAAYAETRVEGTQTNYVVLDANQIKSATDNTGEFSESEDIRFSTRTAPAPTKTQDVYKLMRLGTDGKLYPLFIGSAEPIELGTWYDAESPNLGDLTKLASGVHLVNNETGEAMTLDEFKAQHPEIAIKGKRPNVAAINWATENGARWIEIEDKATAQRRYEGESRSYYNLGIKSSGQVGQFAMRPGWHAGSLPTMRQIGKGKNKNLRDDSFVWVKGRIPADVDYQSEADANPDKDIPTHIPTDGFYMKATNANKKASQADKMGWYVAGSFIADEIMSDAEARSVIDSWNAEHPDAQVKYDYPRESGREYDPKRGGLVKDSNMFKTTVEDYATMPVDELVEQGKMRVSAENQLAADEFMDRIRAINGSLNQLRMAAAAQRKYDQNTVQILANLANDLLASGKIADPSKGEVKRLISVLNNATGKRHLEKSVERLMDIMIANQLRHGRENLDKFLRIRGKKVDARGVEVKGRLDIPGQQIMDAIRNNIGLDLVDILFRMIEVQDNLTSESETIRRNAENELIGLEFAKQYVENIRQSENEEKSLRKEVLDAEAEYKAGARDRKTYTEFAKVTEEAIRENRTQRVLAYQKLIDDLAKMITQSIQGSKFFNEREKERVEQIQHFANSDMQGMPADAHKEAEGKFWNNGLVRLFTSPLATFEQWLRVFGAKSPEGKGYLYNHFMGSWAKATDQFYLGMKEANATLDTKAREVFGRKVDRWSDLFAMEKELSKGRKYTISFWDDGEMKEYEVTQGNLLYIYMVNKMIDGKMKLRKMGISEDDVDAIERELDPRFITLADWIQEEFLPGIRDKYNAVHERLFGAPMAAIDNYFPIKVLANARVREVDLGVAESSAKPSTITGSIIKRTKNSLALDVLHTDAFDVVLEHIEQMEQWAAFAEFNRDLNTLLSYKKFRNRVQNMSGVLGAGKEAWNSFRETAEIAAGVYQPKTAKADKLVTNAVKGLTAGKISFRLWTAMKQVLAMPAFLPYVNPAQMVMRMATPWESWNWAMENLPAFEKRWKSREAGNVRLKKTEADYKIWQGDFMETATRLGMTPNAFVDAVTCAIGSHSVFLTQKARYEKDGYRDEQATKKAKLDAMVVFNATQQSSESAFLSAVQSDRTFIAHALTVFRNNSFGMQREFVDALRNFSKRATQGFKEESIEFMKKQMVRDGLAEDQAGRAAERVYNRSAFKDAARIATFGFLMQFLWNLGGSAIYLLFGDDDDEKEKMIKDAAIRGTFGSIEGLGFGNVISEGMAMAFTGDLKKFHPSLSPAGQDIESLWSELLSDPVAGVNELINILVQAGIGANPQVLTDAAVAIYDACDGDIALGKEIGLAILRILQVPQSQIDKLKMDEIDFTKDKGLDVTIAEFAKEYAEYKKLRNAPLTNPAYSDEQSKKIEEKYIKRFLKDAEELKRSRGNEEAKKYYEYLDTEYKEVTETINSLKKKTREEGMKGNTIGAMEYAEMLRDYTESDIFQRYSQFGSKARAIEKMRDKMMKVDPKTRETIEDAMLELRREMVEEMESANL